MQNLLLDVLFLSLVCFRPCKSQESVNAKNLNNGDVEGIQQGVHDQPHLLSGSSSDSSSVITCEDKEGYDLDPYTPYPECCDMDERECTEDCPISAICEPGFVSTGYEPYFAVCMDQGDGLKWWGQFCCVAANLSEIVIDFTNPYGPTNTSANVGQKITIQWEGQHCVEWLSCTATNGSALECPVNQTTSILDGNKILEDGFSIPGNYDFWCCDHQTNMAGTIIVAEPYSDSETSSSMGANSIGRADTGGQQSVPIEADNNEDGQSGAEIGGQRQSGAEIGGQRQSGAEIGEHANNGGVDIQERVLLHRGEESPRRPPQGELATKETSSDMPQDKIQLLYHCGVGLYHCGAFMSCCMYSQECCSDVCCNTGATCCGDTCCSIRCNGYDCCGDVAQECCDTGEECKDGFSCNGANLCVETPGGCFSDKSEVTLLSSDGQIPALLEDVLPGDKILAFDENGEAFFDEVYWIHYLHLEDNTSPMLNLRHEFGMLRLTTDHLVYIAEKREMFSDTCIDLDNQKICVYEARHANVGDSIWVVNPETMKFEMRQITDVTFTRGRFLTPVTFSGNLVVDGVAVSSFCKRHDFGKESAFPIRMVYYLCGDCTNHIYADYAWESLGNIRRGLRAAAMYLPPGWGRLTMFFFYFGVLCPVLCPIVFLVKKLR